VAASLRFMPPPARVRRLCQRAALAPGRDIGPCAGTALF